MTDDDGKAVLKGRLDLYTTKADYAFRDDLHMRFTFGFAKKSDFYKMRPDQFVFFGNIKDAYFNEMKVMKHPDWNLTEAF